VSRGAAVLHPRTDRRLRRRITVVPNGVDAAWAADARPVDLAPFGGALGRRTLVFRRPSRRTEGSPISPVAPSKS